MVIDKVKYRKFILSVLIVILTIMSYLQNRAEAGTLVPFPGLPSEQQTVIGNLALASAGFTQGSLSPNVVVGKFLASPVANQIYLKGTEYGGYVLVMGATAWAGVKDIAQTMAGDNTAPGSYDAILQEDVQKTYDTSMGYYAIPAPITITPLESANIISFSMNGISCVSEVQGYGYVPSGTLVTAINQRCGRLYTSAYDGIGIFYTLRKVYSNGEVEEHNQVAGIYKAGTNWAQGFLYSDLTAYTWQEIEDIPIPYTAQQNLADPAGQDSIFEQTAPITEEAPLEIDVTSYIADPNTALNVTPQQLAQQVVQPEPIEPPLDPPAEESDINWDKLKMLGNVFTNKFPFSLPWDLFRSFSSFNLGEEQSHQVFVFDLTDTMLGQEFSVNMEFFEDFIPVIKMIELAIFDIGLILATRRLLGGDA